MPAQTAFILGATGFVGGHLLDVLATTHPDLHLQCLVRKPTPQKINALSVLNGNVKVIEGSLDDTELITVQSSQAKIVINVASSDHLPSVEAILAGLQKQSERDANCRPVYLHMSGLGVIADNVKGEKIDVIKEWTDVGFKLEEYGCLRERRVPEHGALMSALAVRQTILT